jgi:hypothetical protein
MCFLRRRVVQLYTEIFKVRFRRAILLRVRLWVKEGRILRVISPAISVARIVIVAPLMISVGPISRNGRFGALAGWKRGSGAAGEPGGVGG